MKPTDEPPITEPHEPRESLSGMPLRRIALWLLIAAAILVGLYLYFRLGARVTPVLGGAA